MTGASDSEIEELEQLAFSAWPAERVVAIDGWRLRNTHGVTRRANSVFACGEVDRLEAAIARVEAVYASFGQPAIFQLSPASRPLDLESALTARGYIVDAPVSIQTADLVTAATSDLDAKRADAQVSDRADRAWNDLAITRGRFSANADVFSALLARIGERAGFALARLDGVAVASALCVHERGRIGIFSMAVVPEARRQGAASALLRAIAAWGLGRGATTAYLQVERENPEACSLYARAGFRERYGYHYRVRSNAR